VTVRAGRRGGSGSLAGRARGRGALAALACAALLAGCGLGAGEELEGAGVELRVTRDFGRDVLGAHSEKRVREDQTVMRLLGSEFDVGARFGGRFVQSIDGLEGSGMSGRRDWFFYVNGVESSEGAAEYELSPGDRVQWDYRPWDEAEAVPAIVGAFPEPFLHGLEGKRRPVRLECADDGSAACRAADDRLEAAGVPISSSTIGAPNTETVTRLVVATWPRARIVRGAPDLERGPEATGVFARIGQGKLELLDASGAVARTVRRGDGTALVAALRPRADELVWIVTGLDDAALLAGARALTEGKLRDAFAVAVTGDRVEKLPLEGP
jgi:hypothetical protein